MVLVLPINECLLLYLEPCDVCGVLLFRFVSRYVLITLAGGIMASLCCKCGK